MNKKIGMIIPKAAFLNYTYCKAQGGLFDSIKQESQRVMGQLVMELRNPEIHRQGEIQLMFAAEQYPRLSQDKDAIAWHSLQAQFQQAGYVIQVQHHPRGFSIHVNWTQLSLSPPSP
ncbi:hypothetical protein GKR67_14745 [Providencia alcalifaciens]|uniref:Uncharacterized protein n=2 Tax=Providencia alcalifaciens TaxID=126385 RepID=A0AAW9VEV0_9GAMM|nr:hypothetical protein [Providencia alcalifaciens]MTC35183.1 hypothetical protein [Providencia alcalifaciens]MTC35849.1 hypothetical protein [Providencia alcalifaciens]MTC35858.1 hypothetical protein [Providencia alcalifaciens]